MQVWARGLSPQMGRKTYWSNIRRQIVWNFQILIVSAVKICRLNNVCKLLKLLGPLDPTGRPPCPRPPCDIAPWKFLETPLTILTNTWIITYSYAVTKPRVGPIPVVSLMPRICNYSLLYGSEYEWKLVPNLFSQPIKLQTWIQKQKGLSLTNKIN